MRVYTERFISCYLKYLADLQDLTDDEFYGIWGVQRGSDAAQAVAVELGRESLAEVSFDRRNIRRIKKEQWQD